VRGHADAATLAAFREELLSARKAAQVSAHLAACPRCAALEAQLAEVTAMLNRATAPPMPEALTARIQAALAAEAAARTPATAPHAAPEPAAVPAMSAATGHDGSQAANGHRAGDTTSHRTGWRGHDRSWLALRVAAVTAAVAVIAGGGYGVSQLLTGGSPAVKGAASGTGAAAPNIKTIPAPGMSAGGIRSAPRSSSGGGGSSSSNNLHTMLPLVLTSGTNYQPATLGAQASTVLKHLTHSTQSSSSPAPIAPGKNQATYFPDLQACLIHIDQGQRPQLVDLAKYRGHPALIVVLPSPNGGRPHALAIAPGCNSKTAQVLATAPLPRTG
jgi:hypothetical protein